MTDKIESAISDGLSVLRRRNAEMAPEMDAMGFVLVERTIEGRRFQVWVTREATPANQLVVEKSARKR